MKLEVPCKKPETVKAKVENEKPEGKIIVYI